MKEGRAFILKIVVIILIAGAAISVWDRGNGFFKLGTAGMDPYTFFGELKEYSTGEAQIPSGHIKQIDVIWAWGNVEISEYEGDYIVFDETYKEDLSDIDRIKFLSKNGKLIIRYNGNTSENNLKNLNNKTLYLKIPQGIKEDINLIKIMTDEAYINVASDHVENLVVSSKKGNVNISGDIEDIKIQEDSGHINIEMDSRPDDIDIRTNTGNTTIQIPENNGFQVDYKIGEGSFLCDFPLVSRSHYGIYKKAESKFDIRSAKGNLSIKKTA